MFTNIILKTTTVNVQQYKSKKKKNECWIIKKVKTKKINSQQYKSEYHNTECPTTQK